MFLADLLSDFAELLNGRQVMVHQGNLLRMMLVGVIVGNIGSLGLFFTSLFFPQILLFAFERCLFLRAGPIIIS
jgi:hypothetical protein